MDVNSAPIHNWRAFLLHIATHNVSNSLAQLHHAVINPLLPPTISADIRPLLLPVITLSSALTIHELNHSPKLQDLWRCFMARSQAHLLHALIIQPIVLLTASSETKTLLCQVASSLIVPLIYARLYTQNDTRNDTRTTSCPALISLILELPSLYIAVQRYRDIPLDAFNYWIVEHLDYWQKNAWLQAYTHSDLVNVCLLISSLAILWTIKKPLSPPSSLISLLRSLLTRLINLYPPFLPNSFITPLNKSFIPRLESMPATKPLRSQQHANNAATQQVSVPLLTSTAAAANMGWQSRRPAGIAVALASSATLITYGGYKLVMKLLHGLSALNPREKPLAPSKASLSARNRKALSTHYSKALHISNFTPRNEIDAPILSAARKFLSAEFPADSTDGIALIAALANQLFDNRLDYNFTQLNLFFRYLKQAAKVDDIGLSGHKSGNSSEVGLIIWTGHKPFDLAQDIAGGKINHAELRDAVALIMHLTLRASGTAFPILISLNEVKYHAVSLYYQWYLNHRPNTSAEQHDPKTADLTMGEFYHQLEEKLRRAIAPFNPHQVDVKRLIHFLIYLEMPNVAIGIQFNNGSAPAISKQNSYAIHADLSLKNKGDELRVDNYLSTIEKVKHEDIRTINLITHSELFAATFRKQGFIADIHRWVFNTEYEIAEIEKNIHDLGYFDRMAMITVVVSELGAQQRVPWTAKRTIPYPGKLSIEQAFTRIHNYYKQRESTSGRSGAVIPRSHMIAIERHRNWLEQYIALGGNLTVMLEVDPQVFDNFTKHNPQQDIRRSLQKMMPLKSINTLFHTKYDRDIAREHDLIRQTINKSLELLSVRQRELINSADGYMMVNLLKYAHTFESAFAQLESTQRELFPTWKLATLVIIFHGETLNVFAFNRRHYLKTLKGELITLLREYSHCGSLQNTLSRLFDYMSANPQLFIETNTHQRCPIPMWAITAYSFELETRRYTSKQQVIDQLCRDNLQPRQDMKRRAYAETAEERELAQDIRWLALRPWLPFIECYDFTTGLANEKEKFWITALDGLTCGLNFIPAGKIVTAPFKIIIKGAQKITRPGKTAMKTAVMHSVDRFFSGPIPGVTADSLGEFRRLYKNIYSDEIYRMSEKGLSEILIDGIYTFVSRGSPIPLPNIFKWNMKMLFHAVTSMNKGFLLKTIAQGIKSNAAPAMGFIGEKIAPKVFRSVRRKLQTSANERPDEFNEEIFEMISNPQRYLPYDITFNEERCNFNRLRLRCELETYEQISPVKLGAQDSVEQLTIRRALHQKLLLALFQSDNPHYWQRSLNNVSVEIQVNGELARRTVSFIAISPQFDPTLAYLKEFYVTLWDREFDGLLLMINPRQTAIKSAEAFALIMAKAEAGRNIAISSPVNRWESRPQNSALLIAIEKLAQSIRGASYLPDVEDDLISSRYLANLFGQLALFSLEDWDKNFVIAIITQQVQAEKIFLGNVTEALLQPFIRQMVQELKGALDVACLHKAGADCFYRLLRNSELKQEINNYQSDLSGRLPSIFINTKYRDFIRAREGRPNAVPSEVWSLITADEVYLSIREQIHRLVYRHYDRFMTSYDYQKVLKGVNKSYKSMKP
ncbi:hypothetical protein SC206_19690 [Rouxiella sp. T17]|uniref:hypothetical protein n=1 Tax=Rouxiella sp. T17 TaxID=3085684 RepID=UPI002FC94083